GSFGAGWGANPELASAAREGLLSAVDQSFRLGDRLSGAVAERDRARFLRVKDIHDVHAASLSKFPANLPQIEPGQVRTWTFGSGFGVASRDNNRGIVTPMN